MQNKRSKVLWVGKDFLDQAQISEVKDRLGNLEIQSNILKKDITTNKDLAEVLESIKEYNIIIVQKSCFKNSILKQLLEYNKEKIKKAFYAFCVLKRRTTRKTLVKITNADEKEYYGQIEL